MVKGHGLSQVAKQTEIGDEPVRTSYYLRRLGFDQDGWSLPIRSEPKR